MTLDRFLVTVDQTHQATLLIGHVADGTWTTAQSLSLYQGPSSGPVSVTVTPDGSTVFVADPANHQFVILSLGTNGQYALAAKQVAIPGAVSVAILPDGTKAYVLAAVSPNTVTVVDVATPASTSVSVMQSYVNLRELVVSPDGRRLFAADESAAALRILDPQSLRILQTVPLAPNVSQAQGASGAAIAPDGSRIFVTNTTSGTLSVLQQTST